MVEKAKNIKPGLIIQDINQLPKGKGEILKSNPLNYKTAEEYVKAQGTPVYHGSQIENIKELKIKEKNGSELSGIYLTPDYKVASEYGKVSDTVSFKPTEVTISGKILNVKDYDDLSKVLGFEKYTKEIKKQIPSMVKDKGYDGIKVLNGAEKNEIIVFNENSVKTKSQLISEWNKAQPLKSLVGEAKNQTYYHGTNSTFDNFVKQVKAGVSDKATAQPIFLTNDIKTAKAFSQSNTGRIIETKIAPDTKIFDPMSLIKKGEYIEESSIFSKIKSYFKKDGISSDKADELTRQVFDPFNSYGAIEKPSFQRWL
ncbi:MAG: hypothetical protein HGA35_02895, partial [Erysipelotrichaceae bacterium]|nr:hypothetical protein [Erysipelotrichaceae bacterium]